MHTYKTYIMYLLSYKSCLHLVNISLKLNLVFLLMCVTKVTNNNTEDEEKSILNEAPLALPFPLTDCNDLLAYYNE